MTTTVGDVMATPPITVSPQTTVPEAVQQLRQHGIRRLPVLEDGQLVGIVTDRDLKEAMPSSQTALSIWDITAQLARLEVRAVMSASVIAVAQEAPLRDAAYSMLKHKVGGLPVVDAQGALVGVVTATDVMRDYLKLSAPEQG